MFIEKYLVNTLGVCFLITSIFDALKYGWSARKVRLVKSSKGHSRQFINVAILNDIVRLSYGVSIHDWYIVISSALAMYFMLQLFIAIYEFYPYKARNLKNFKRPNIFVYLWNSIIPNRYAPHL